MKNHIKNYIKIMGLAAVPFGTAQVHGGYRVEIEIKSFSYKSFKITTSVSKYDDRNLRCCLGYFGESISCQYKSTWIPSIDNADVPSEPDALLENKLPPNVEKKVVESSGVNMVKFSISSSRFTRGSDDKVLRLDCILYLVPVEGWGRFYRTVLVVKGVERCLSLDISSEIPVLCYNSSGEILTCELKKKNAWEWLFSESNLSKPYQRFNQKAIKKLSELFNIDCNPVDDYLYYLSDVTEDEDPDSEDGEWKTMEEREEEKKRREKEEGWRKRVERCDCSDEESEKDEKSDRSKIESENEEAK